MLIASQFIPYNSSSNNKTLNARLLCRDTSLSQELHSCSYITPIICITNSYYIAPICIYLYIIINALNETEHAYSLELELDPTFCRFVLHFFVVFALVFLFIKTCK